MVKTNQMRDWILLNIDSILEEPSKIDSNDKSLTSLINEANDKLERIKEYLDSIRNVDYE